MYFQAVDISFFDQSPDKLLYAIDGYRVTIRFGEQIRRFNRTDLRPEIAKITSDFTQGQPREGDKPFFVTLADDPKSASFEVYVFDECLKYFRNPWTSVI